MARRRNGALRREQELIEYMISQRPTKQRQEKQKNSNVININTNKPRRPIHLVPKSTHQEVYIDSLQDPHTDVVIATGPAGTGKTYLAMLAAIQALRDGETERIILTRPAVAVDDEKHGFLPGDLTSKMEPWTRPLLDVLRDYYPVREVHNMLSEQIIEISPLAYMRGRTFKNSWVILDEAQNATPNQIKMLLTRIGSGAKIVITGDIEQTDRHKADNGLMDLQIRLSTHPVKGINLCQFTTEDIQRHRIIEHVLRLYS